MSLFIAVSFDLVRNPKCFNFGISDGRRELFESLFGFDFIDAQPAQIINSIEAVNIFFILVFLLFDIEIWILGRRFVRIDAWGS